VDWSDLFTGSRWTLFPIEASWLTGVLIALGGGQFVIIGLNLTMVSDISEPDDRLVLFFASPILRLTKFTEVSSYTLRSPSDMWQISSVHKLPLLRCCIPSGFQSLLPVAA
jgi:hypothetical protein